MSCMVARLRSRRGVSVGDLADLIMHCPSCGRSDLKMGIQGSRAENSVVLLRSGVFVVLVMCGWIGVCGIFHGCW